jgi:RNA polymerase primary sigma factor
MEYNDDSFAAYLKNISNLPLVSKQEEIILAAKVATNDNKARERLINANLRLVVKIAQEFTGYGLPLMDLISEGNIGLMKAVDRFKPEKGGKLSTYASWWIKQGIKRSLANKGKIIRIPVHLVEKMGRVRKVAAKMAEELGREPTIEELAIEVGMSPKKLQQSFDHCIQPVSLEVPTITEDESKTLGGMVQDESVENPLEALINKDLLNKIPKLLAILEPREREIIILRFGLNGKKELTLEEVGDKFKITRERIRQLQNLALEKMLDFANEDIKRISK